MQCGLGFVKYPFIDPPPPANLFLLGFPPHKFCSQILSFSLPLARISCSITMDGSMKLLLLALFIAQLAISQVGIGVRKTWASAATRELHFQPLEPTEYRVLEGSSVIDDARRRLAPFQLCLVCKCCTASSTTCATMPCCFGIDCQLPNKPFGVCAFVPKSCNCTSCAT